LLLGLLGCRCGSRRIGLGFRRGRCIVELVVFGWELGLGAVGRRGEGWSQGEFTD
jgi:hypothetical protein